ncbi:AraC family transcriptional regulator [Alcanivorax sp. JB21]|uniref:AraC family transcriptional regulator n=1 Tax=Alcanivorax limicola TaxID=2874102 RepID=UPI001CC010C5|nr:AraC family transcriptional regulator [Alcanivorax limicola]MBZ2190504.1 AraC family transcriptional regulator [Alcanivorax limicola]
MTILKMNPDEYSVAAEYVPLLVGLMEQRKISREVLFRDTDIAPDCWREPGARVAAHQFEQLISRAMALTGDDWLGWEFGAAMTMSTHGFLGYAALSSETLGDAIELAVKFFRTRSTVVDLQFVVEGDTAVLQLEEMIALNELAPFVVESLFSSFHFMALKVLPDLEMDGELRFAYPEPHYFRKLKPMVPVPCLFDCAYHQMRFPAHRLERRLRFADPRLARMAAAQCEQELANIKAPPRLLGQVRRIVLSRAGRFPGVDEVASDLHMSSRTLKRKLQQLGTSYQKVLDDLRKGLAVEHLTQTSATVDDIALFLGYSDASNFARAFRRWTGRSPTDYRE